MKLPVIPTLIEAYRLFFANLDIFARLVWFPVVVQFAAAVFARNYLPALDAEDPGRFSLFGASVEAFSYVLAIPASTAWCRLAVFGRHGGARISYSVGAAELRYVFWGALIVLIVVAIAACLVTVAWSVPPLDQAMEIPLVEGLVATTLFGLAYLCVVRLLLVLPAVAIGRKESFVESFRLTRGNGWRLSLLVLLALWPTYICYEIIEYFLFVGNDVFERVEPIEYLILEAMISWFFFTIDISVMAMAFKMLVSEASLGQPMSSS